MDLELRGKRAVVTGGTRGIGYRIVHALAEHGVEVIACCRTSSPASERLDQELRQLGGGHQVVVADVTDPDQVHAMFERGNSTTEGLDILVNNAGVISFTPYEQLTLDDWTRMLQTNLSGVHLVTQAALPHLRGGGSVISIGSQTAEDGVPQRAHYDASKTALLGWNRSLAKEFGNRGIRFNVLSLGGILTEEMDTMTAEERNQRDTGYARKTALGRQGTTDEVADALLWLASDHASYVTGSVISVDGGL